MHTANAEVSKRYSPHRYCLTGISIYLQQVFFNNNIYTTPVATTAAFLRLRD